MDWANLIVPIFGALILVGVVIVGWISVGGRGQMPERMPGQRGRMRNRRVNPKTGSMF
jgi:hypothetical protein